MNANFSEIDFELQRRADLITQLSADLTAAQERIRLLEGAIEGAPHGGLCDMNYGPCLELCEGCTERCKHAPSGINRKCTCWKAVLAPKEPTDGR